VDILGTVETYIDKCGCPTVKISNNMGMSTEMFFSRLSSGGVRVEIRRTDKLETFTKTFLDQASKDAIIELLQGR